MNAAIFAFTERGIETARRIRDSLGGGEIVVTARFAAADCATYDGGLSDRVGSLFDHEALVFVGAAGIAVRAVAPHVRDKLLDPAVLCVDERVRFVVPLLSGHIGGANRLAQNLAAALGAMPVITTATDINGRFAVDAWAAEHGFALSDMALAKRVSATILTSDVPFCTDALGPDAELPAGLTWGEAGELGMCASVYDRHPFDATLLLIPRALRVGVGCKKGTPREAIDARIARVFRENQLRLEAVREVATVDAKRDEPGLVACCAARGWRLECLPSKALAAVPGDFDESEFVRETVGVGNVCERAAMARGGRLIVPKTAENGVTVAVAELEWGMCFG